jgi:hypothetical protein
MNLDVRGCKSDLKPKAHAEGPDADASRLEAPAET